MAERQPITTTIDGRKYQGTYTISSGKYSMITVTSIYGSKRTQLGNTPVEDLAKMLLGEIILQNKTK